MKKKIKTIAEIWVGGMSNPAYRFEVKSSMVIDGKTVVITAEDGTEFETSIHNIVMISYEEGNDEQKSTGEV